MPSNDNLEVHDYAERIRERLPRKLQELREAVGLSKYGLARNSGISREYIGKIERGTANPTLPVGFEAWSGQTSSGDFASPESGADGERTLPPCRHSNRTLHRRAAGA